MDKKEYLDAMIASHTNSRRIRELLQEALTDKINDRDVYMNDPSLLTKAAEMLGDTTSEFYVIK